MKFNFLVRTKIEIVYTYKLVNKGNQWLWWNNLKQKQYFKKWSRKTEHLFLTPLLWSKLTPTKHYGKFLKTYHIYLLLPKSVQLMSHFPLLLLFTLSFPSTSAPHGPQPYEGIFIFHKDPFSADSWRENRILGSERKACLLGSWPSRGGHWSGEREGRNAPASAPPPYLTAPELLITEEVITLLPASFMESRWQPMSVAVFHSP